jgi:hypothetical protein
MKVIDEKGRLFGLINPVDLLILLVVVLVAAGIGVKAVRTGVQQVGQQPKTATLVVHVRGASAEVAEGAVATNPQGIFNDTATTEINATVESVTMTSYTTQVSTDGGELVNAVDPIRKDLTFTITGDAAVSGNVYSLGNQEIRVGRSFIVKTDGMELNGVIESIVITDKE